MFKVKPLKHLSCIILLLLLTTIKFFIDTINVFNDCNNSHLNNVIDVIMSVKVLTIEIGSDNPLHYAPTHFEPTWVGYNINVCKDTTEGISKDVN